MLSTPEAQTTVKHIHDRCTQDANVIPEVVAETVQPDFDTHFPNLVPLSNKILNNNKLHTRKDVPDQCTIYKHLEVLNTKTKHFYYLPFKLDNLHKDQRKGPFFSSIISYLDDSHLLSNPMKLNSIIAEPYNYLLFDILFC